MTKGDIKEELLIHWSRKFKELCTVNMIDGRTVIFVHSYEIIKKLFVQYADYFSSRPKGRWLEHHLIKGKGNKYSSFSLK